MTTEQITGWQRRLEDGRVEIFLKSADIKLRAHGGPEQMNELIDWFEGHASCAVNAPWRVRSGPTPIRGQLDLLRDDQFATASHEAVSA